MFCAGCGGENRADAKFCGDCGAPFGVACDACGATNEAGGSSASTAVGRSSRTRRSRPRRSTSPRSNAGAATSDVQTRAACLVHRAQLLRTDGNPREALEAAFELGDVARLAELLAMIESLRRGERPPAPRRARIPVPGEARRRRGCVQVRGRRVPRARDAVLALR